MIDLAAASVLARELTEHQFGELPSQRASRERLRRRALGRFALMVTRRSGRPRRRFGSLFAPLGRFASLLASLGGRPRRGSRTSRC